MFFGTSITLICCLIFNASYFTPLLSYICIPNTVPVMILWKYGKVTSDESRVIHPSTRKVVFLTYKFYLPSSSYSINNPGLVMLVFLHCLPRENPRHRAQETFLCLLPKPQKQMLSVCFHNLKYINFWFSFFPS